MIKVYFDDVLIDTDSYTQLDNEYKLFADNFKLGSTASNSFYLSVVKSAVSSHPSEVRIEDDTTTWNFIVDDITANDNVYTYVLVEKLVDFNFNYDASVLINEKAENGEDCYLSDIWHDMCLQAGIEYDETYVFENDIVVTWYDSRVQARKYLSFIAELQSGYACMLENGKQTFKKQKRSSVKTIDADECSDLIVGEKKKITRVVFDGGAFKWEFGDETGDTLYLQSDNVFIVNEQIVENIYNNIKDFEFYTLDVPQAPMDSTVKAGDIITFDDNGTLYPTIAQYKMSYAGGWVGGYQLKVSTTKQQETQVTRTAENVKNLKVDVDRLNNEFSIVAEQIDETSSQIVQTTQDINSINEKIEDNKYYIDENGEKHLISNKVFDLSKTVDGIDVKLSQQGGSNLLINPVGLFGNYGWTGVCKEYTDTEIKNNTFGKSALYLQDGTRSQIVQVPNGTYTVSFLYKKLISLANCTIDINGYVITLDSVDWAKKTHTFEVKSNKIEIKLISDTNDSCYVSDLMLNKGLIPQAYSSNATEVVTNNVKIGDGIEISSNASNIKQKVDNDGNRIINTNTGQIVSEFTDKGMSTNELKANKAEIAGELIARHGNQVWHSVI